MSAISRPIENPNCRFAEAGAKSLMYARLWWKDARQFWPIWVVLVLGAAATQWMVLISLGRRLGSGGSAFRPCSGRASTRWRQVPRLSPGNAKRARSGCWTSCPPIGGRLGGQSLVRARDKRWP